MLVSCVQIRLTFVSFIVSSKPIFFFMFRWTVVERKALLVEINFNKLYCPLRSNHCAMMIVVVFCMNSFEVLLVRTL